MIISHTPAGTSVRNIVHFAQEVNDGTYARYNYGYLGNRMHYGQSKPPSYNLSTVLAPVVLMWGPNDWLAVPEVIQQSILPYSVSTVLNIN